MPKKINYNRRMKRQSRKEMLEKEGFKLAFGLSIILLGVISIYYDTPTTVLIGISISALLFTFIDTLSPRKGLYHFIPITVLLIFCIFPNIKYLEKLLNPKLSNAIIFFSFGASFLISSINTYKSILMSKRKSHEYLSETATMVNHQFDNYIYLMNDLVKIKDTLITNPSNLKEVDRILKNTQEYIQNEYVISKTKYDLALKGQEEVKDKFSMHEIENAIQNTVIVDRDAKIKKSIKEIDERSKTSTKKETKPKKKTSKKKASDKNENQ